MIPATDANIIADEANERLCGFTLAYLQKEIEKNADKGFYDFTYNFVFDDIQKQNLPFIVNTLIDLGYTVTQKYDIEGQEKCFINISWEK